MRSTALHIDISMHWFLPSVASLREVRSDKLASYKNPLACRHTLRKDRLQAYPKGHKGLLWSNSVLWERWFHRENKRRVAAIAVGRPLLQQAQSSTDRLQPPPPFGQQVDSPTKKARFAAQAPLLRKDRVQARSYSGLPRLFAEADGDGFEVLLDVVHEGGHGGGGVFGFGVDHAPGAA